MVNDPPNDAQLDLVAPAKDPRGRALDLFNETFKPFVAIDDFTILYPEEQLAKFGPTEGREPKWFEHYIALSNPSHDTSKPEPILVADLREVLLFLDRDQRHCEVRIHACRSFDRSAWTLTVRWLSKPNLPAVTLPPQHSYADELRKFEPRSWSKGYLFGTDELVNAIWSQWPMGVPSKGMLLVTGETGSQKSQVTRGLIFRYLMRLFKDVIEPAKSQNTRKPHLLTFEDPIESLLRPLDMETASSNKELKYLAHRHLDYTPRVLFKDVTELRTGLMKDALRQTPALVFAGELREPDQFRACLDFAGTGHLIIATAHAGSVVEALAKLLAAAGANTSGDRAIYASRILSVLHLKKLMLPDGSYDAPPVMPAMWRQTATGVQQLVADGLVSLLPANPNDDATQETACLGRSFFVHTMTKGLTDTDLIARGFDRNALMVAAFKDDLNLNG